ncbi:hypothetical protein [Streptomyces bungoensis]|uniref:hypothetical protein n=1 Tax=Streptomyces bungoensis TaxID=285568 RepID=UPI00341C1D76
MLALRLTHAARPAVHLRRLLVGAASAGTGFLLLAAFGWALAHPARPDAAALRLAWCVLPLAATAYFALAVARTDPGTRPRSGLSAVGLGPARMMAISALTTALASTLGSLLALLAFLHLRGDLTGGPFGVAAPPFAAAGRPLPLPATLTLLALVPALTSATVALALRPRDPRPTTRAPRGYGRFGAYGRSATRETFGAYGRFGARRATAGGDRENRALRQTGDAADGSPRPAGDDRNDGMLRSAADDRENRTPRQAGDARDERSPRPAGDDPETHTPRQTGGARDGSPRPAGDDREDRTSRPAGDDRDDGNPRPASADREDRTSRPAGGTAPAGHAPDATQPNGTGTGGTKTGSLPLSRSGSRRTVTASVPEEAGGLPASGGAVASAPVPEAVGALSAADADDADWAGALPSPPAPREAPAGLPWGVALLAAGLAVQAYAGRSGPAPAVTALPVEAAAVPAGWVLTAAGLVLASPGLAHLCGRLLQSTRPGALRLLAGRGLMAEATRIGRPLGVVCAVASAMYAMTALYDGPAPSFGPLTTLAALVVAGCTVATLLTAAVEARQCRADTTAALLRLGARAAVLRGAAALRVAALLALFGPLTLLIAHLAALPSVR